MKDIPLPPQAALRPPEDVMRLARMGQAFPSRLSFLRVLLRRLKAAQTEVHRSLWEMDASGYGRAIYTLDVDGAPVSLVAVSQALPDAARSDRVIAEAWDVAFVLYDGVPDAAELARLTSEVPRQEAGRFGPRDLVLSRANKSMRVWQHVVQALQTGSALDQTLMRQVGYLMRTTAVYGNGKFGIADRHVYDRRETLAGPFAAEMLCVWLIRQFTIDLVEHVGGATLPRASKRALGVGNATGLGMAPFLVSHPVLLNNWMTARETALARVRALDKIDAARLAALFQTASEHLANWHVPDAHAAVDLAALRMDWSRLEPFLAECRSPEDLYQAALPLGLAAQELVVSLLIELTPDLVDGLADCMADPFGPEPAPLPDTAALRSRIAADWSWAMCRYEGSAVARFWYVSANKLEPRLGDRFNDPGADLEGPLHVARSVAALAHDLPEHRESTCAFLARYPEHAFAVQRVSTLARYPYAEIRDNLIADACRPIDMLRCKLAFFGATRFDPKSDLWTRITLAQGAPLMDEIAEREMPWLMGKA